MSGLQSDRNASTLRYTVVRALAADAVSAAACFQPEAAQAEGRRAPAGATSTAHRTDVMAIRLRLTDGRIVHATLLDNPTAQDFAGRLPITLTLTDYATTEKVADIPNGLAINDAPEGYEPKAGDIAYYAPWGNLAIFHRAFRYSPKLVRLGG